MQLTKPPILVDMDGVLVDFYSGFIETAKQHFPKLHEKLPPVDKMLTYNFHESISDFCDETRVHFDNCIKHPLVFHYADFYEGAIEGLLLMKDLAAEDGRDLFLLSSPVPDNPWSHFNKANDVLNELGVEFANNLILSNDKTLVSGVILIDDHPTPVGKFKPSWEHIVFDQLYNKDVEGKRMMDWSYDSVVEIMEHIKEKN